MAYGYRVSGSSYYYNCGFDDIDDARKSLESALKIFPDHKRWEFFEKTESGEKKIDSNARINN